MTSLEDCIFVSYMGVRLCTQKIKIFGRENPKLPRFKEFFLLNKQNRFGCSVKTHSTKMTENPGTKGVTFDCLDQIFFL